MEACGWLYIGLVIGTAVGLCLRGLIETAVDRQREREIRALDAWYRASGVERS